MNRKVLTAYGILRPYDVKGDKYDWAERTTIVVDKKGVIQHVLAWAFQGLVHGVFPWGFLAARLGFCGTSGKSACRDAISRGK